ncbi:MAG: AEC family transporter [Chthoniobacter sp.]|uniref:AEC family transporter n=1 Tax=Chthoniobacter sp. TaxID=2510640 RepID=UPI0032ACD184
MSEYLPLLAAVAPVFVIITIGWLIRRIGWLTEEADASLLRVIVNLLYPCLILDTILGNRALEKAGNVLLAPVAGFTTVVLGYAVSYFAAPLFGAGEPRQRRTFAFTTGIYNYGYLALPIAQTRFGPETSGVLFIHNVGVEIALWTVGIMVISGAARGGGWRKILNGPVLAIVSAATLHFAGARSWMPGVAMSAIHSLGATAIPLGVILTGATFADHMRDLSTGSRGLTTFGACLLRLGLLPLCMLALARWLPCPIELRHVIVIQAAMPCGMIPVILAKHYGGDPAAALRIILYTSAIGLLTIPFWLQLGLRWIGEN